MPDNNRKSKRRKGRLSLPKKEEDLMKITEEVLEREEAHTHHHHHHHSEVDELVAVLELLVDSLMTRVETAETRIKQNTIEIARIYKILSYIVEALAAKDEKTKAAILSKAREILTIK